MGSLCSSLNISKEKFYFSTCGSMIQLVPFDFGAFPSFDLKKQQKFCFKFEFRQGLNACYWSYPCTMEGYDEIILVSL